MWTAMQSRSASAGKRGRAECCCESGTDLRRFGQRTRLACWFGVTPKRSFLAYLLDFGRYEFIRKVRDRQHARRVRYPKPLPRAQKNSAVDSESFRELKHSLTSRFSSRISVLSRCWSDRSSAGFGESKGP